MEKIVQTSLYVERGVPLRYVTKAYGLVSISKATRRMAHNLYHLKMTLRRINKLLAKQKARAENEAIRREVRTLKTEKRKPHARIRTRDQIQYETLALNPLVQYLNADGSIKSESVVGSIQAESWGRNQWIYDVSPVLKLNPPRSPVRIGQLRKNSLRCSIKVPYVSVSKPQYFMRPSRWPLIGLRDAGQDSGAMQSITWNQSHADAALVKAYADLYENLLNSNEYFVEWKQVLGLLRDPFKTAARWGKTLKRWTSRDSWIWTPQRSYRKLHDGGVLTSQLPVGGVLMSMRTRRCIDPKTVSKSVVDAAVNRWLQYRYGIAPLVLDVNAVMGLWLHPKPAAENLKSSARHWVERKKVFSTSSVRRVPFQMYFERVREYGTNYSATVFAVKTGDTPQSFEMGVHPSQWKRVIWNSIPYSFVGDWLVDVDKWLTSQIQVPWVETLGNCVTAKRFDRVKSTPSKVTEIYSGRAGKLSSIPTAVCLYEAIERRIDLPRPTDPPVSKAWQTLKNAATALALAINISTITRKH